jgi:hypothetical protein
MKDEYIIINKTQFQKRIDELESKRESDECSDPRDYSYLTGKINQLEQTLSQSTPLIPELEKIKNNLFQKLRYWREDIHSEDELYDLLDEELHNYLSNLKIDIK